MNAVYLKSNKLKPVKHRHPWLFSGAIERVEGKPEPGEVLEIKNIAGEFLAWGYYNPHSQIALRLLAWEQSHEISEDWWREKLEEAIRRRTHLLNRSDTTALRLVNAESDMLPGLIVDKYADFVVLQSMTAGIERVKPLIVEELERLLNPAGIHERGDPALRKIEGLSPINRTLTGNQPPDLLEIQENGQQFFVDILHGQKTGFYLDQRDNRTTVAEYAPSKSVLDCFSYSGGFGLYALSAGAGSVTSVDASAASLDLLKRNYELNSFSIPENSTIKGDVFQMLRTFREQNRTFDMVILDPPKFAPTKRQVEKAQRGYKDLNRLAISILNLDGILATFSCSSGVSPELFQRIVAWAAMDTGREVQILRHLSQAEDHPVRLSFPESHYLKGLICRVL